MVCTVCFMVYFRIYTLYMLFSAYANVVYTIHYTIWDAVAVKFDGLYYFTRSVYCRLFLYLYAWMHMNSPNARVIFAIRRVFAFVTFVCTSILSFYHTVLALFIGYRHKFAHIFRFAFLYHAQTRSPVSSLPIISRSFFLCFFFHFINGFVTRI